MPQILLRDMRVFRDGLERSRIAVDELIVMCSESKPLNTVLADANLRVLHKDTAVRAVVEFAPDTHKPSGEWWTLFTVQMDRLTRTEPQRLESEKGIAYTWNMDSSREQFSIQVIFRGAKDGDSAGEDGTDPEPTEIQDDPDGVGGGARHEV